MKYCLSLIFVLAISKVTFSQTPIYKWAKKIGSIGDEYSTSVKVDVAGNVYTTGYFNGTADFDPGAGVFNLTSAGSNDVFISKLDPQGNFVWAKRLGGTDYDIGVGLALDASGNVYTTGGFGNTVDFDPGAGVYNLTEAGGGDIFISKLDAAGNFVWAKQFSGVVGEYVNFIATDASGNVYTTGAFNGTTDFDPAAAVYNLTAVGAAGDAFVTKLDAAGNFVWAKQIGGGAIDYAFGYSVAADAAGSIIGSGSFFGTVDFDPNAGVQNLTSTGNEAYIFKLDAAGNFVWANTFAAATISDYSYSYAVTTDAANNIYTTGYFAGDVDFDPGPGTTILSSVAATDDIYVVKLNAAGSLLWAKQIGGTDYDYGYSISTDALGNVYTTGNYTAAVDFDPGAGTFNLSSNTGTPDIFISKLDAAGNFAWAKGFGSNNFDNGAAITVDALNSVYTTGVFKNTVDFDPDPLGVANLISSGSTDVFVQKMLQTSVLPAELLSFTGKPEHKNNLLEWQTAAEQDNDYFTLEKSSDGINFLAFATIKGAGNSTQKSSYSKYDYSPYGGITYYRLKQTDFDRRNKYSAVISISNSKANNITSEGFFPNPADDKITYTFYSPATTAIYVRFISSSGSIVKEETSTVVKGKTILSSDISRLPAGTYLLKITSAADPDGITEKFIKQ